MENEMEALRKKLYMLLLSGEVMSRGEILRISQELDKRIAAFYLNQNVVNSKLASGY